MVRAVRGELPDLPRVIGIVFGFAVLCSLRRGGDGQKEDTDDWEKCSTHFQAAPGWNYRTNRRVRTKRARLYQRGRGLLAVDHAVSHQRGVAGSANIVDADHMRAAQNARGHGGERAKQPLLRGNVIRPSSFR